MSSTTAGIGRPDSEVIQVQSLPKPVDKEKAENHVDHVDHVPEVEANLVYDDNDEEPELHLRTYFALAAMFLLNLVQTFALQGPPAVVWMTSTPNCRACGFTDRLRSFLSSVRTLGTHKHKHGFPMPLHSFKQSLLPSSALHRTLSRLENCFWSAFPLFLASAQPSRPDLAISIA